MGLFDNGLLGGFDFGGYSAADPSQGLLNGFYDQGALDKAKRKRMLLSAGLAMMAQGPSQYPINMMTSLGQGLQQGMQTANDYEDDYHKQAMDAYGLNQRSQELDYQHGRDAQGDSRWQQEFDYRQKHDAAILAQNRKQNGQDAYFGTPLALKDADGNFVGYGLPSKEGGFKRLQPTDGLTFASPYDKAFQTKMGGSEGENEGNRRNAAPSDIQTAQNALDLMDQIRTSSYLDSGTGFSSYFNSIPGTGGYDFQNLVDQAKSGAFLSAIQQMRGMGSLSNAEGDTATKAVTRMNTATSKEAFVKALDDYETIVRQGMQRAQSTIGKAGGIQPIPQGQPTRRLRYNPETGELE